MTADGFASSLGSGEEEYAAACTCGTEDDEGGQHAYDCPRWDGVVQPSPCTDDSEAQDVEVLARVICAHAHPDDPRRPEGYCALSKSEAEWLLASDWLAARERAAAEKARADERERIALAMAQVADRWRGRPCADDNDGVSNCYCGLLDEVEALLARSQP